jgi:AraC-like DNA-binding protein
MRQFKKHKGCTPSEYRRRKENAEKEPTFVYFVYRSMNYVGIYMAL